MKTRQIVLDTNVLIAGLRSRRGASHKVLQLVGSSPKFEINVSVPLVLEYEATLKREARSLGLTSKEIDDVLDYICLVANKRRIFFLWRPYLPDAKDEMALEVAVESGSDCIVTFNRRHFAGIERFGIEAVLPGDFLRSIGEVR